jgi:hypothetical protein
MKVLKRVGYGRVKLDLFRQRILHHLVVPVRAGKAYQVNQDEAVA